MRCPICGSNNRKCVYSKELDGYRTRTYKCFDCNGKYRSKEVIVDSKAYRDKCYKDLEFSANELRIMFDELAKEVEQLKIRLDKYDKLG